MEKRRSVWKALAAAGGMVVLVVVCILVQRYIEKMPPFFPEQMTAAVEGLPEPDRIIINAGPADRDFSDWEEGAREAAYEQGSEEYKELYELTKAGWKKAYLQGKLSDEEELMTYAHRWSSEPGQSPGQKPVGLMMFFEYDEPILWNKNNMETAEAIVFLPDRQEGAAANHQGEFSVRYKGRFLDMGCAYAYCYTKELVEAVERLAP